MDVHEDSFGCLITVMLMYSLASCVWVYMPDYAGFHRDRHDVFDISDLEV